MKIGIEVITKKGGRAARLYRIDYRVWCNLFLEFPDEEAAKEFTKNVGVDANNLIEALEKREKGHFIGNKWSGEKPIWEEEIKKGDKKYD